MPDILRSSPAGTVVDWIQTSLPPFSGPRLKVERAKKHYRELENMLQAYCGRTKPVWGSYYEPHFEHMKLWTLTLTEHPPGDVPLIVGDIAHNLRSALDIMMCDIARLRDKSTDNMKFLFAVSESDWDGKLKKHAIKRLGPDVVAAIRALEPYRSSGSKLRSLHDLDILDKHEVVSPFMVCYNAEMKTEPFSWYVASSEDVNFVRHEMENTHIPRLHGEPFLAFRSGLPQGSPFARQPVLETMDDVMQAVDQIVESFAENFGTRSELINL